MPTLIIPNGRLLVGGGPYTPGSQPPTTAGYMDHEEWWAVQRKAGLRQVQCGHCVRSCFPQEVHSTTTATLHTSAGRPVQVPVVTCNACAAKRAASIESDRCAPGAQSETPPWPVACLSTAVQGRKSRNDCT